MVNNKKIKNLKIITIENIFYINIKIDWPINN